MTPHQIVPVLAQEGRYYASESSLYRILKKENKLHHRENTKPKRNVNNPPERVATAPNQVRGGDIPWLPTVVRGYSCLPPWILKVSATILKQMGRAAIVGTSYSNQEKGRSYEILYAALPGRTVLYFFPTCKECIL